MATQHPEYTVQQTLDFCAKLKADNDYYMVVPKGCGEYLVVRPLIYHWTLMRGTLAFPETVEERWCYRSKELTLAALAEWEARQWQGEPVGWHRHPTTGRRRPEGLASREYVEW